jgi:hypothetical protein
MVESAKRIQMIAFLSSIPNYSESYICDLDTLINIVRKDSNKKFKNIHSFQEYIFAKDKDIKYSMDQTKEILKKRFDNFGTNFTGTILVMSGHGGKDVN